MARPADRRLAADCWLLSLSFVAVAAGEGAVVDGTNKQIFAASRCLESSVLPVRLLWLRSGYEYESSRVAGSCAVGEAQSGAGGRAHQRPSTMARRDETQAIRAETQRRAVSSEQ